MAIKEKKTTKKKKITLALQGGGALGAYTWGILEAILSDGRLEIEGISGTSAGAMNALALASGFATGKERGAIESLHTFWYQLSLLGNPFYGIQHIIPMLNMGLTQIKSWLNSAFIDFTNTVSPYVLNSVNYSVLRHFIEENFNVLAIQKSKFPKLFLTATHIRSGKIKVFQNVEITTDSIMAMICLPMLFQAACVDKEFYWDGGLVANPAIFPLIYGCKKIKDILIVPLTRLYDAQLPKQVHEIKARYNEIILNSCLIREIRSIHFITQLIDEGKLSDPNINRYNLHIVKNEHLFNQLKADDAFNIDWDFLSMLHEKGIETGNTWIKDHFNNLGKDIPFHPSVYRDYVLLS